MKNSDVFNKISAKIDSYYDDIVRIQTELTAIPALGPENDGEGEAEKADYIKTILKDLQFDEIEEVNAPDTRVSCGYRPNILAKVKGKSSAKTIWCLTHMDVVPPGELKLWDTDPYKVIHKNGRLYGRGVEDNQQGMVATLMAIKALREEGVLPEYNIGLALVADEETGNKYGLKYVLEHKKETFQNTDLILVPDSGQEDGTMIEVAEKSILWVRFRTIGKQAHGSRPAMGNNAHRAAAHLITKLDSLYSIFNHSDPVFAPPTSTFEPTKKEANVPNVNTIPGEDVFYMDCRILPKYTVEEVEVKIQEIVKEIEEKFGVRIETSSPQRESAAPPTAVNAPVVRALSTALQEVTGKKGMPMGIGGGTVAALFRQEGFPAAVWETIDKMAHQENEYCIMKNVISDSKVFAHIFLQD